MQRVVSPVLSLDNIVANPVPEAAPLILLIAGLTLVGARWG
jgi:hypothetical protein